MLLSGNLQQVTSIVANEQVLRRNGSYFAGLVGHFSEKVASLAAHTRYEPYHTGPSKAQARALCRRTPRFDLSAPSVAERKLCITQAAAC
jgi:hypothetical protein